MDGKADAPGLGVIVTRRYDSASHRRLRKLLLVPGAFCWRCGTMSDLTVAHIDPNGPDEEWNVRVECRRHNASEARRRKLAMQRSPQQPGGNYATHPTAHLG
jgi:hypothetical protein